MSESQSPASNPVAAERIRLADADDPRDVVHRAVACLARGGLLGMPTDAGYALAASASAPLALQRLREAANLGSTEPLLVQLRGPAEVWDWAPDLSLVGERFAYRGWPGPLCLRLLDGWSDGLAGQWSDETRSLIAPSRELALNCSAHPLLRNMASLAPGPIVIAPMSQAASPEASDVAETERLGRIPGVNLLLDDGPALAATHRAVVELQGEQWEARTLGPFQRDALQRMAGTIILFVCTGNTCRSPMAEALCKQMIADRLGCAVADLTERGYTILSAGISAGRGWPASSEAIAAVRRRGASLDEHGSRPAAPELIASADLVLAMTYSHLDAILSRMPHVGDRAVLLDPDGGDVADPYGGDARTYEDAARMIEAFLIRQLDRLGIGAAAEGV